MTCADLNVTLTLLYEWVYHLREGGVFTRVFSSALLKSHFIIKVFQYDLRNV